MKRYVRSGSFPYNQAIMINKMIIFKRNPESGEKARGAGLK
jgi:hypothetical protein